MRLGDATFVIGLFLVSSRANSDNANNVFNVNNDGNLNNDNANNDNAVRPAVFLKSGVTIDTNGKDGSFEHPYTMSY